MRSIRERVEEAHSDYSRAHHALLSLIVEAWATGSWRGDGDASLAAWVANSCQVSYKTARQWVSAAQVVADLPAVDAAYGNGDLSIDQLTAVGTLAAGDPQTGELRLEAVPRTPIEELQRDARAARARKLERDDAGRYLRVDPTFDERYFRIDGRLHFDEGAVLLKALDRHVPASTNWREYPQAYAAALVGLARDRLTADVDRERATIVVHVDTSALQTGDGVGAVQNGSFLPMESVRRLLCRCADPARRTGW